MKKNKKKENSELIKNSNNENDPSLKEVIEYDDIDNEKLIKDISASELNVK
jgi:hypothetical protein